MSRQNFINTLSQKIDKIDNFPVLKSLAIAQACLESAFGTKSFYNNVFGIKCHSPDKYAGCRLGRTAEFIDGSYKHNLSLAFQTYHSIDESLEDYARLMNISRYKPVREAKDYMEATEQIRKSGYATSPTYTQNLRRLIEQYKLYELDRKMTDIQLTKNFRLNEFQTRDPIPQKLMGNIKQVAEELQKVRDILNRPIIITSGYRSPAHNRAVGGATNSQHLYAKAADCRMVGINTEVFRTYLARYTKFNGFGIAPNFVHVDTRDRFTVWVY